MTAAVNVNAQPPGPKYSMAGAPWRKERTTEDKSPGPGSVFGVVLVVQHAPPLPRTVRFARGLCFYFFVEKATAFVQVLVGGFLLRHLR